MPQVQRGGAAPGRNPGYPNNIFEGVLLVFFLLWPGWQSAVLPHTAAVLNRCLTYLSAQVVFNSTRLSLMILRSDPTEGVWEEMCWWLNCSSSSWISTCLCRKRKAEEHVTHSLWTCSHRDISLLIGWKTYIKQTHPAWVNSQLESGTGIAQLEWCWSPLHFTIKTDLGCSCCWSQCSFFSLCCWAHLFEVSFLSRDPADCGKGSMGSTDPSPCERLGKLVATASTYSVVGGDSQQGR